MKRRKLISLLLTLSLLAGVLSISVPASAATQGQNAFEGPFFYTGMTTTTYQYYTETAAGQTYASTIGEKTIASSETVTEEQVLPYYLHIPINYDPNKSYPIITFCSGDGITVFSEDFGGDVVDFSKISSSSPLYTLIGSYMQTKVYKNAKWDTWGGCNPYNDDGTVKSNVSSLPHYSTSDNSSNYDDQFVENWYDLVYNQGKEEYDCFFIFLNPTDRFWFENTTNKKLVTIQNLAQSSELLAEYGNDIVKGLDGCTCANITSTYVSSALSANVYEQLLVQLIDSLASQYSIDLSRQYLAGFSLGAMFSYDTACHYPNRFACVMTSGLPSVDLSEENCKNWVNTNFWGFNGNSDYCDDDGFFTSEFINKVNSYKTDESTALAYNTVISGGHNGQYIAGKGSRVSGQTVSSKTSTYDFMFTSVRTDACTIELENNKEGVENLVVSAKASTTTNSDGSYNIILISGAPLGDYSEHGFVITTGEEKTKAYEKTKTVAVNGMVKSVEAVLGSETVNLSATDYGSAYLYTYSITNIPASVTEFTVKSYAISSTGTYYSDAVDIAVTITGSTVSAEVK